MSRPCKVEAGKALQEWVSKIGCTCAHHSNPMYPRDHNLQGGLIFPPVAEQTAGNLASHLD